MNLRNNRPLCIVGLAIGILAVLSFFEIGGNLGPFPFKKINLFSDLNKTRHIMEHSARTNTAVKNASSFAQVRQSDKLASLMSTSRIIGSLDDFFADLYRTEKEGGTTRIAYFGDSLIESDLITADLRKNLQKMFGGNGVGFVPITEIAPESRGTIRHTFSKNWQVLSLHPKPKDEKKLGLSGFTFLPQNDTHVTASFGDGDKDVKHSWVEYSKSPLPGNAGSFHTVKLYYGPSDEAAYVKYALQDNAEHTLNLRGNSTVNEAVIVNNGQANKIRLNFFAQNTIPIYGVSFEDTHGVYVDNFSIRGYSGITLSRIPKDIFSGFDRYLDYRLIIIHYGANMTAYTTQQQFDWYKRHMVAAINHLKHSFPRSSFLVISVNDMGQRDHAGIVTKPSIPLLVKSQQDIARETGVGFWNLFEAMGGKDSMGLWVAGKKPLASKDYTHFNQRGAKKVADLLTKAIVEGYENYKSHPRYARMFKTSAVKNTGLVK